MTIRYWAAILAGVAAISTASVARAQEPDVDQRRSAARELAQQGDAAFRAGRCDRAIPLWQEANTRFPAPTILFRVARCQALLGRVVDATRSLQELLALPDEPDSPQAFREAKEQAASELPAVQSRIAYLSVVVDTRGLSVMPDVRVDDRSLPLSPAPIKMDPGSHVVRVRAKDTSWEQTIVLEEGHHETVRVAIEQGRARPVARTQRTVGYLIGGLGVTSMATGAVFAALASNTARDLDEVCGPNRKACPPDKQGDIDRLKTHAVVADLTIGAGAALFAAGAIVVLTEPAPKAEEPRVVVFPVGLGAAVQGRF